MPNSPVAAALDGDERANLEVHIQTERELLGQEAVNRFLNGTCLAAAKGNDAIVADEAAVDTDDEDDGSGLLLLVELAAMLHRHASALPAFG